VIPTALRRHRRRVPPLLGALLVASATGVLAVLGPATASAARHATVCPSGCTYTTIASALAAAHSGDRITVAPGTYAGGFTISKDVTLKGAGAGQTIVSGGAPVITIAEGVDVELKDVTVSGGNDSPFGGGILNRGRLSIKHATIENNRASGRLEGHGGGIYNEASGDLTIASSVIRGNVASDGFGGGVFNAGTATIKSTSVTDNQAGANGGGVWGIGGSADTRIVASWISGNMAGNCGGGLGGDDLDVSGSAVVQNSAQAGGGVCGNGVFRTTQIAENQAIFGGGIVTSGAVDLRRSSVTGNRAGLAGGGIYVEVGGSVEAKHSVIAGNTPEDCFGC
jgi:fibronectin-binding autotransporter adhesin